MDIEITRENIDRIIKEGTLEEKIQILSEYSAARYQDRKSLVKQKDISAVYKNIKPEDEETFNRYIVLLNVTTDRRDAMYLFCQRLAMHWEYVKEVIRQILITEQSISLINNHIESYTTEELKEYVKNFNKNQINLKLSIKEGLLILNKAKADRKILERVDLFNKALMEGKTIIVCFDIFVKEENIAFLVPNDVILVLDQMKDGFVLPYYKIKDELVKFNNFEDSGVKIETVKRNPFRYAAQRGKI